MASKYEDQINALYTIRDYLKKLNENAEIKKNYASMLPFERTFDAEFENYMLCLIFVDNKVNQTDVDIFNSIFETDYTLETFKSAKMKANYRRYFTITDVLAQADLLAYKRNAYVTCGGTPISKTFIELVTSIGQDLMLSNAQVASSEKLYYQQAVKVANTSIDNILGVIPGWKLGKKFTKTPEIPVSTAINPDDLAAYADFDSTIMNTSRTLNDLMGSIQADLARIDQEAKEQAKNINALNSGIPFNPYTGSFDATGAGYNGGNGNVPATGGKPASPSQAANTNKAAEAAKAEKEPEPEKTLEELMEELNSLIGLNNVKKEVNSLTNLLKVNKVRKERGLPAANVSLHLVFYGNPGTGKTTIARLLAGIYKQLGFLSKGQCVEVDRGGLVGGFVGQTALKTKEVIDSALGGVLFIDEAYALTENRGENDFGQEAVDTLLKAMEDNRDDFVVIVAGYPDLMEGFVNSNPGLKSRFTRFIEFQDYTVDELMAIFARFCKKAGFTCTEEATEKIREYFTFAVATKTENFANARFARNTFEQLVANQANRIAAMEEYTDEELMQLTIDDLTDGEDEAGEGDEEKEDGLSDEEEGGRTEDSNDSGDGE